MSSLVQLTSILHRLISLLDNQRPTNLIYRHVIQYNKGESLRTLTKLTFHDVGVSSHGPYSILLLREVIMATFEALCMCVELDKDISYCYAELKNICVAIDEFNELLCTSQSSTYHPCRNIGVLLKNSTQTVPLTTLTTNISSDCTIEFADLADVYIRSHADWIASLVFNEPTLAGILNLSQFEGSFSRALLGIVATYTSMMKTSNTNARQKMAYVSDELFLVTSSDDSKITWLDCLIPGAQSETLRVIHGDLSIRMWRKVAESLVIKIQQVLLFDSWALDEYIPRISLISQHSDLESHSVVVSCLKHVISSIYQKHTLSLWDTAFQKLVIATLGAYRKGFKTRKKNTLSPLAVSSDVLAILGDHSYKQIQCSSPLDIKMCKSVLEHMNNLKHSTLLCFTAKASLTQVSSALLQTFGSNMSSWNLVSLAELVFQVAPIQTQILNKATAISISAGSPQVTLPVYTSLHSLTCSNRDTCTSLHEINTYVQDTVVDFFGHFQDVWANKCAQVLISTFPPLKYWRSYLVKKREVRQIVPNSYCELILEHLFLPLMDAAVILPEVPQNTCIHLMITVFYNEYRKIITSNKKLYDTSAGRQLLTDYRYIQQWLTSQQLHKSTLQLLARAPVVTEFEEGLMVICGTANVVDSSFSTVTTMEDSVPKFYKHFPVFSEIAWNSMTDWNSCIAIV